MRVIEVSKLINERVRYVLVLRYDMSKIRSNELVLMYSGRNSQMTVRRYWDDKRSELK